MCSYSATALWPFPRAADDRYWRVGPAALSLLQKPEVGEVRASKNSASPTARSSIQKQQP